MAYRSRPMGNRLGIYADKIERSAKAAGLDAKGFRQDSTDPLKGEKEGVLRELYCRADSHLPSGIGGNPPPDSETEGLQDEE